MLREYIKHRNDIVPNIIILYRRKIRVIFGLEAESYIHL